MSHVTDVKLRIHDLDALAEACERLGLELRRDQKTYAWWGRFQNDSSAYGEHRPAEMGTCEHAIRVKGTAPRNGHSGPWEIGVVAAKDGDGYGLYYDTFGGAGQALTNKVGPSANALRKEYAACVATRKVTEKLSRHGWRAVREDLPTGGIRIKVRKR